MGNCGAASENSSGKNRELNDCARNTDDIHRIRGLVEHQNADMLSTNGGPWYHTPLHQACFHNRPAVVEELLSLLHKRGILKRNLSMASAPGGRGGTGLPIELARGAGLNHIVEMI